VDTEAVVVHCSDHRFQAAFRDYLVEGLALRAYALMAVPGGGHFVSMGQFMPKFTKSNLQSISFLMKRTGAPRLILIGHDDCLFFRDQFQFYFTEATLSQRQFTNLRAARKQLLERFSGARVDIYFADAEADGSVQFIRID
jgi:hypothetical protein